MKSRLDASMKNTNLFYSLYIVNIASDRSTDLTNFLSHENQMVGPVLSNYGELRSIPKPNLIPLLLEDIETCSEFPRSSFTSLNS